jgi:hypothetical protein
MNRARQICLPFIVMSSLKGRRMNCQSLRKTFNRLYDETAAKFIFPFSIYSSLGADDPGFYDHCTSDGNQRRQRKRDFMADYYAHNCEFNRFLFVGRVVPADFFACSEI